MAVELDARAAGARRLADKVCVVTGAGQGIGRAVARRLGQEGGRIVVADRIDTSATRTLTELREQGVDALKVLLDLSTFVGAQSLVSQILDAYGRIDVLVNNVGGTIWIKPYHLYSEEEVKLELERSLYPTLWCCSPLYSSYRVDGLARRSFSNAKQSAPHFNSRNETLWKVSLRVRSVRLDAGELDHLAPLLRFVGYELSKVGRRAWKRGGAQVGKPRLHLGIGGPH